MYLPIQLHSCKSANKLTYLLTYLLTLLTYLTMPRFVHLQRRGTCPSTPPCPNTQNVKTGTWCHSESQL